MGFVIILLIISLGSTFFACWKWAKANEEVNEFRKTHTSIEAARQFNKQILQENEVLIKNKENNILQVNQLNEQKQKVIEQVKNETIIRDNMRREYEYLTAQIGTLNRAIEESTRDQKRLARDSFESYCDALDIDYFNKEKEYDNLVDCLQTLYIEMHDSLINKHEQESAWSKAELAAIKHELDKMRATRAAAMEAQLREEEIKNQATFYTLQLNEADKRDVKYLQSIEFNLREARPLRMLIWSTFYRDKLNDLAARVGAVGASGIYKLTHIESGISYVGQAKDIKERWVTHVKCSLGIDTPVTSQLYAFTREKGIDNFTFEILEKCSINELNEKEKFYIDLYQTYDFGLNATKGNK